MLKRNRGLNVRGMAARREMLVEIRQHAIRFAPITSDRSFGLPTPCFYPASLRMTLYVWPLYAPACCLGARAQLG